MIVLSNGCIHVPAEDRLIGFVGDHNAHTREFVLTDLSMKDWSFKLDIRPTGAPSDFIDLDKTVEHDHIVLRWTIQGSQLPSAGKLDFQLRAINGGKQVWHSSIDCFLVGQSVAVPEQDPWFPSEFREIEARVTELKEQAGEHESAARQARADAEAFSGQAGSDRLSVSSALEEIRELQSAVSADAAQTDGNRRAAALSAGEAAAAELAAREHRTAVEAMKAETAAIQQEVTDAGQSVDTAAVLFATVTVPASIQAVESAGQAQAEAAAREAQAAAEQAALARSEVKRMHALREQYALYGLADGDGLLLLDHCAALPLWSARLQGTDAEEGASGLGGALTVRVCGENLLDGELAQTILGLNAVYRNFANDVDLPAGTYTLSCETRLTIVRKRIDGVSQTISPITPYTFTLDAPAKVNFAFRIYTASGSVSWTLPESAAGARIQLQAGEAAQPFSPCSCDSFQLAMPGELRSAGDFLDLLSGSGMISGQAIQFDPLPLTAHHGVTRILVTGPGRPAPVLSVQYAQDPNLVVRALHSQLYEATGISQTDSNG